MLTSKVSIYLHGLVVGAALAVRVILCAYGEKLDFITCDSLKAFITSLMKGRLSHKDARQI